MEYTLIRAKRKTVTIQIKKDGSVIVRAPMRLANYKIESFVKEKEEWITANREKLLERRDKRQTFKLSDGKLPLMAHFFPIEFTEEKKAFYRGGVFYLVNGDEQQLRAQAAELYKTIALEEIRRRVSFYAPKIGAEPCGIKINGAKGRWGSCSGKNSLNFSWRLMLASERCINYVVVHELCHILHHDHSKAFWQEVERFSPDWKSCRDELRKTAEQPWFISD